MELIELDWNDCLLILEEYWDYISFIFAPVVIIIWSWHHSRLLLFNSIWFNNKASYWTLATLQNAYLLNFPSISKIYQTTLWSRLKDTFGMSYKRIKIQRKITTEKQNIRRFAFAGAIQIKLESLNYELIFIDEFSLSDRSFKFFGWSKRGKSEYKLHFKFVQYEFFIALSTPRFYGILGTEGTGNSKKFIHFLIKVFNERKKLSYQEANKFVLIMDNASIYKTLEVSTFIIDSKMRIVTIPPYEPSLNLL